MPNKLYKFFRDLINTSTDSQFNKFYYRNRSNVLVVLLISSGSTYTYEKICNKIPSSICSRTTIKTILNEGVKRGYFIKNIDHKDKRNRIYNVNKEIKKEMKLWEKRMKEIFI